MGTTARPLAVLTGDATGIGYELARLCGEAASRSVTLCSSHRSRGQKPSSPDGLEAKCESDSLRFPMRLRRPQGEPVR